MFGKWFKQEQPKSPELVALEKERDGLLQTILQMKANMEAIEARGHQVDFGQAMFYCGLWEQYKELKEQIKCRS